MSDGNTAAKQDAGEHAVRTYIIMRFYDLVCYVKENVNLEAWFLAGLLI